MEEPLTEDLAVALDRSAARRGAIGRRIHYYPETSSTNDVAARLAEAGAPEGTTVVASAQSAGRGRFGRRWFSPPGAGLYVSVVVRDRRVAPLLTLAGGVAVADGIGAATGLAVEIKWPNDIVVETGLGRRRKLAGILAEATSGADGLQFIVLGFGINLRPANYPPEVAGRATSLERELGREVPPGVVLAESLAALAGQMTALADGRVDVVLDRWRTLSPASRGSWVEWDGPNGPLAGRTAGIDAAGALLVQHGAGLERIISGTVRWSWGE